MHCFITYLQLSEKLIKIVGIGPVRSSHIIQLSSLLGLIPIQMYVYLPIHRNYKNGGPSKFVLNELGWSFKDISDHNFLVLYEKELLHLQDLFNINFTSNMFENLSCILGQSKE